MNVEITINCETEADLLQHLSVIRKEVKREIEKNSGSITEPVALEDDNCYGTHTVSIIPDCTPNKGHFPDGSGFCLSCGDQLPII